MTALGAPILGLLFDAPALRSDGSPPPQASLIGLALLLLSPKPQPR